MSFHGADPEALETAAGRFDQAAGYADAVLTRLRRQLTNLVYLGQAGDAYRSALSATSIAAVERTAAGLRERAGELRAQARQQRRTSTGRGAPAAGQRGGGRPRGGAAQSRPAPAPKPPPWIGQAVGGVGVFKGVLDGEPRSAGRQSRPYVIYPGEVRVGGSRAWRNNNPGNLKGGGEMAQRLGATGHDGRFAIFPTKAAGDAAQRGLIQQRWPDQSIREMISGIDSTTGKRLPYGYAPKTDSNNPDRYVRSVGEWSGIDVDRVRIRNLTPQQMDALIQAMQRYEHQAAGTVVPRR